MVVQAVADLMTHDADGDYLAIIGCGNPNRSDDGVGPAVLALLRSRALPDCIKLYDTGTDGMGVMYPRKALRTSSSWTRWRRIARPAPFTTCRAMFLRRRRQAVSACMIFAGSMRFTPDAKCAAPISREDKSLPRGSSNADARSRADPARCAGGAESLRGDRGDRRRLFARRLVVTSGVDIRNGSVYLPAETVDRYFRGVDCVILLIRDGALLILPVRQAAAGGCPAENP